MTIRPTFDAYPEDYNWTSHHYRVHGSTWLPNGARTSPSGDLDGWHALQDWLADADYMDRHGILTMAGGGE